MSTQLFRSTATVSLMTLISRVLGFARDIVIAKLFGASVGADAFFVAFRLPHLLRRLFTEGAFSQAFVPILSEYKAQRPNTEVKELVDHAAGSLIAILMPISLLGMLAAPVLVLLFAPGFTEVQDKQELTAALLRITFPYILFISLTALCGGILNSYGRFAVPAFTPTFLNLSIIGAAIWLSPALDQPVLALAWGVFAGGIVQLLFQLPFLVRLHLLPIPRIGFPSEGGRRMLRLMGPAIFGVSVVQINLLIDTLMASFLVTGSVSWLYYSDRLVEFPLGVVGLALSTVILPSLSEKHAKGATEAFSSLLDWALRWIVMIGVPASLGLAILAGPILCTLFHYGEFESQDVEMAGRSLIGYAAGLPGFILIRGLAPGYYSRQDTKLPVRIGVVAVLSNLVLNLLLIGPLAHAGLALATSLSAYLNAGLLHLGLRKAGIYRPVPGWAGFLVRVGFANALMTVVLILGVEGLEEWLTWSAMERGLRLTGWVIGGGVIYLACLWLLGLRWGHMTVARSTV